MDALQAYISSDSDDENEYHRSGENEGMQLESKSCEHETVETKTRNDGSGVPAFCTSSSTKCNDFCQIRVNLPLSESPNSKCKLQRTSKQQVNVEPILGSSQQFISTTLVNSDLSPNLLSSENCQLNLEPNHGNSTQTQRSNIFKSMEYSHCKSVHETQSAGEPRPFRISRVTDNRKCFHESGQATHTTRTQFSLQTRHDLQPAISNFGQNVHQQNPVPILQPYTSKRRKTQGGQQDYSQNYHTTVESNDVDLDRRIQPTPTELQLNKKSYRIPQKRMYTFTEHSSAINRIRWNNSQDSHLLASASMDRSVRIWDPIASKKCVQTFLYHGKGIRDVQWSQSGDHVLSCGYDKTARLCHIETGKEVVCLQHPAYVTCVKFNPAQPSVFLSGTYESAILCWDTRINKEKYTCPTLISHPHEDVFLAQTNGDYIGYFSAVKPYKMMKTKRCEGHSVSGYSIGCDISADGNVVITGSADGKIHFYDYKSARRIHVMSSHQDVCIDVAVHPISTTLLASCSWGGVISLWQ
ncbi:WD repeat-containing protein 25-like isoform X2 [Ptychodera flava]|uniref:WD repeat-containing protein 25-like isoform X2 n=1 Tax=Ptychodera flava TaxID=63121 RepID=UPI00396A76D4